MQVIQGLSNLAYWAVNMAFDLLKCLLVSALILALMQAFNLDFPDSWALLIEYPFAIVPFTYASSFLFSKETTG